MPALSLKKRKLEEYISGFIDGEGCFSVSFSKRPKFIVGWETKPSFSVSQNRDRAEVLFMMKEYFKSGFIRDGVTDNTIKYEVRRLDDLIHKVIPHFVRYPLLSSKQNDFELFKEVCFTMAKDKHTTIDGFQKILPIAFQMNASGRRKYSQDEILKFLYTQMKV
tara:strand:- start:10319 stop:10810 length:492 start_codon:yes stop_codon:yes gene_type:complete